MITKETGLSRIVLLRLETGEDILNSIQTAVNQHGIRSGVILSGVGSTSKHHYHVAKTVTIPIENEYTRGEGALDIVTIQGVVMDGRVHAHITLSKSEVAIGGHMEEGCIVLSFSVITIAEVTDIALTAWDTVGHID